MFPSMHLFQLRHGSNGFGPASGLPTTFARIRILLLLALLWGAPALAARQRPPLYLVNGEEWSAEKAAGIEADDLESIDMLPADEETIARYGARAADGVIVIALKYDSPARFDADSLGFDAYVARHVRWDDDEPAARVALRYDITAEGRAVVCKVLESTDNRLKRRVLKAVAEAPLWTPATKAGRPVASRGVLQVRLPAGKPMPGEPYIRIR